MTSGVGSTSLPRPLLQSSSGAGRGLRSRMPSAMSGEEEHPESLDWAPSQNPVSSLWFEWAQGVPAREKEQERSRCSACLCPGPQADQGTIPPTPA